jgi:hypothetical protein
MTVCIDVPDVPDSCLLPNAQRRTSHHVWGPAAATIKLRTRFACHDALWRVGGRLYPVDLPFPDQPVHITADIWWPKGRRRCDFQAAVHALKAPCDALQGIVYADDAQIDGMTVRQYTTKEPTGKMRLVIEEVKTP